MTLPLLVLVPFLFAVGWQASPYSAQTPAQWPPGEDAAALGGGVVDLPADPGWSTSADADWAAGAPPALLPGAEGPSWDLHALATEWPAAQGPLDSLPSPLAGWSPARTPGDPLRAAHLPRDQAVRIPLAGRVFLFGQAEKDNFAPPQGSRFVGQTGVAWKLPVGAGLEVLLSCGPEVTYTGAARTDRVQERLPLPFHSRLLRVDVQCRWSVLGQVGLECQGSVRPALNPWEHDVLHQDLHIAFPVTRGGQLQVGAKHSWENAPEAGPGPEGGQLYSDFRLIW